MIAGSKARASHVCMPMLMAQSLRTPYRWTRRHTWNFASSNISRPSAAAATSPRRQTNYVTQPTVTTAIRNLENELGVALIDRATCSPRPRPATSFSGGAPSSSATWTSSRRKSTHQEVSARRSCPLPSRRSPAQPCTRSCWAASSPPIPRSMSPSRTSATARFSITFWAATGNWTGSWWDPPSPARMWII